MENLKTRTKLLIGFAVTTAFTLIVGIVGIVSLRSLDGAYTDAINIHGNPLVKAGYILESIQALRVETRGAIIFTGNDEELKIAEARVVEWCRKFETNAEAYSRYILSPDARALFTDAMNTYYNTFKPALFKIIEDAKNGVDRAELISYAASDARPTAEAIIEKLEKCITIKNGLMDKANADGTAKSRAIFTMLVVIVTASVPISLVFGLYISGLIVKPLSVLTAFMNKAGATGDLSISSTDKENIDRFSKFNDEVGHLIASSAAFIKHITKVSGAMEKIAKGDFNVSLTALSDEDVLGLSLKKMADGLQSLVDEVARRSLLLHTVNSVADILLKTDDDNFDAAIGKGMELLADCIGADRFYIWTSRAAENSAENALDYYLSYKYVTDVGRNGEVPLGQRFPYGSEWQRFFSQQECINSPVSDLPQYEQNFFESYNVQSILMMPLIAHSQLSGLLNFDDCHSGRVFSKDEVDILRSACLMLANAIDRHAEAAVTREADERVRLMLNTMPLCCQLCDRNMNILDCNDAAVKLFGFRNKQEHINRFFEISPEYQPDGQRSYEKAAMLVGKVFEEGHRVFEWTHQTLDGTRIPVEVTLVRTRYGDGYVVVAYTRDLREHNRMMNKIESLLFEAQAANHAKSEFMSRISHEMLTPMNAIMGVTKIASMKTSDPDTKKHLSEINEASRQLLRIINNVLDISNIDFDIFKLDNSVFFFNSMFGGVLNTVDRFIKAKQQTFTFDIDDSIPAPLVGDESRLAQVIGNILTNAIKFTPEHGEIHFSARALDLDEDDKKITLQIEVTDNGIGILEEHKSSIFSIFEQVDGGNARKHGGMGLGLAFSKRIIEMMGGRIWVESQFGKGSKFTFTCKLAKVDKIPAQTNAG